MNGNPLEQFRIYITPIMITNITIIMIIGIIVYTISIGLSNKLGTRWEIIKMSIIATIIGLYKSIIKGEVKRLVMIIIIFSTILTSNVLGLIPYGFTPTTHISLTVSISLTIMIGITIMGNKSIKFYSIFIPSGTPIYLVPLLVGIELISYISRVFSLALRLTANILAGHTLMLTIGTLGYNNSMGVVAVVILIGIYILETLVAVVQSYVFVLLTCSYINDVSLSSGQ